MSSFLIYNLKETGSGKKLLSRWTSSNTVKFEDGKTAQTKVGAIKGITTSTSATETGYAADATTVAALNQSLSNINNIKTSNVDGHSNLRIIKSGKLVIITGLILLNGKEKTLNLPYKAQDDKWYAPVVGIGADAKSISAYGFSYIGSSTNVMSIYLSSANTYASINMSYFTQN